MKYKHILFCIFFLSFFANTFGQSSSIFVQDFGCQQRSLKFIQHTTDIYKKENPSISFGVAFVIKRKLLQQEFKVNFVLKKRNDVDTVFKVEKIGRFENLEDTITVAYPKLPESIINLPTCVYHLTCIVSSKDESFAYFKDSVRVWVIKEEYDDDWDCRKEIDEQYKFNKLALQPADCITIDGSTNDNGAMANFRKLVASYKTNNNNKEAFSNLESCIGDAKKSAAIIGHGNVGYIKTGGGNQGGSSDQFLQVSNRKDWLVSAIQIRGNVSKLTLFGCTVGAYDMGADLLFNLAQTLDCNVSAPTGLLTVSPTNYWIEPGAVWLEASPTQRPTPVSPPHHFVLEKSKSLKLVDQSGKKRAISIDAISKISYTTSNHRENVFISSDKLFLDILQRIDLSNPFFVDGVMVGEQTGKLNLTYTERGEKVTKAFIIYVDRVMQDLSNPNYYYYLDNSFLTFKASLK